MTPQSTMRVLIIDDDPMSRDLLGILLEGEGYAVQSADSGDAALVLLHHGELAPDLVLTDMQMPGTTGAQLVRKLRRACGPATIVLAISGSQPPARTISLFDGFLRKPFRMDQVAAALHARIPRRNATRQRREAKAAPAEREKLTSVTGQEPTMLPEANSLLISPSTRKTASNKSMKGQIDVYEIETGKTVRNQGSNSGPVLNESIYQKLAGSVPAQQLREMYTMCVNDARKRIAGMRALAADHDTARFIREAHAIKGGCGMLGATELHSMASELEARGPGDSPSGRTGDVNSLDELSAACDRLERMLGSRV